MPVRARSTVRTSSLRREIQSLDYSFVKGLRNKRSRTFHRSQDHTFIRLPRKQLVTEEFARRALEDAGQTPEQIQEFFDRQESTD